METTLVGRAAPAFTLPASDGTEIALGSLRGKPVVLAFFRGTW
ncbi:redoxin domain-containing protein [bacterium]|nr:MAG: redoxin domain-containing protein [bacterium]